MRRKQVKRKLFQSTFCFTKERIQRAIDGKLFNIIEEKTVYLVPL